MTKKKKNWILKLNYLGWIDSDYVVSQLIDASTVKGEN